MKVNLNLRLRQRIASLLVVLVPVCGYTETAVIDGIEWVYNSVKDGIKRTALR